MRLAFAFALFALPASAAEMQCLPALDGIERVMQMAQR